MLPKSYLVKGLDALSQAHSLDFFADGHRGAATISAYFFCAELADDDASQAIERLIADEWLATKLFAPMPPDPPTPDILMKLVTVMEAGAHDWRSAGHNLIFPTLALKAFHQDPSTITAARINGLCALIKLFFNPEPDASEFGDLAPLPSDPVKLSQFILAEWQRCIVAFCGYGQGGAGHLLTYGRALVDLRELGYHRVADIATQAYRRYLAQLRLGPQNSPPIPDHQPHSLSPDSGAYWQRRPTGSLGMGHALKYAYAYHGLMRLAGQNSITAPWRTLEFHQFA